MMFLTLDEVQQLTGRRRRDAQEAALRAMGIEHRINAIGKVVVSKAHVELVLGGAPSNSTKSDRAEQPNWEALCHADD